MKFNHTAIVAIMAALVAVGCTKVSDKTLITGTFEGMAPESVKIIIPEVLDTTVSVSDLKFSVEVPAAPSVLSVIAVSGVNTPFVSDGTPLTATFDISYQARFVSKYPKISVQEKFTAYRNSLTDIQIKYRDLTQKADSDEAMEELYDKFNEDLRTVDMAALAENKDNIIGVQAITDLQYDLAPAQMDSLLGTLDPKLADNKTILKIKENLAAKLATAEGKMFSDFEVNGLKLSDFVGKGKYMLVDFWASWCAPCKAEIPNVKNIYEKYAGDDFDVLSVAVWDKPQATIDTAKVYGIEWKQMIDAQKIPTDIYGIQGIPHIILFGPDGTILKRDLRGEAIEEEIAKYVAPKK